MHAVLSFEKHLTRLQVKGQGLVFHIWMDECMSSHNISKNITYYDEPMKNKDTLTTLLHEYLIVLHTTVLKFSIITVYN